MQNRFWIKRIFSDEFGFSDLRSNYSRVYSWMANQLGHLTLGLALVLFVAWTDSTIRTIDQVGPDMTAFVWAGAIGAVVAAAIIPFAGGVTLTGKLTSGVIQAGLFAAAVAAMLAVGRPPAWLSGQMPGLNALLLGVAAGTVVLGAGGAVYLAVKPSKLDRVDPALARRLWRFICPSFQRFRVTVVVLILLPWLVLPFALCVGWVLPLGAVGPWVAATLLALVVVGLAKDGRYTVLGVMIQGGVFLLGAGAGIEAMTGLTREKVGLAGALIYLAFATLFLVARLPDLNRSFDALFYLFANMGLALWFWLTMSFAHPDWLLAVSGALASMGLWAVKEFGSDLPNVYLELVEATKARETAMAGQPATPRGVAEFDDNTFLGKGYVNTANWDVRTDITFNLVGAWIGAGLVSSAPMLDRAGAPWVVGVELLGLLAFGLFFLMGGRNWSYRQKALDNSGAGRGNMLAVLDFGVDLRLCKGTVMNAASELFPREVLWRFATQRAGYVGPGGQSHVAPAFDHLIVIGKPRLNQRLADALVTEAALADLPPELFAHMEKPEHEWRRSRKLNLDLMLRYDTTNLTKVELPHNPVHHLWYDPTTSDPKPKRRLLHLDAYNQTQAGPPTGALSRVADIPAADLVAVICGYATQADLAEAVHRFGAQAPGAPGRQTVWTFPIPSQPADRAAFVQDRIDWLSAAVVAEKCTGQGIAVLILHDA